jgi:hypothetical protein
MIVSDEMCGCTWQAVIAANADPGADAVLLAGSTLPTRIIVIPAKAGIQ